MKNKEDLFSLKDKNCVIIGGTGIVGEPITESFLNYGAKVIVCNRSKKNSNRILKKFNNYKSNISIINFDQSNADEIKNLIKKIDNFFGVPDVVVNASVYRPMKKFLHDTYKKFDDSLLFNARGLFLINRGFAEQMKNKKKGSIINISSIYGIVAPDQKNYQGSKINTEPDYPFIKGGIISMTKYFASYYGKHNIRFNTLIPGGVLNNQDKNFIKNYKNKVPLNRLANQSDIKGPAVFLASDASAYVTGESIVIDGGYTII